jgi:hypothetical protein
MNGAPVPKRGPDASTDVDRRGARLERGRLPPPRRAAPGTAPHEEPAVAAGGDVLKHVSLGLLRASMTPRPRSRIRCFLRIVSPACPLRPRQLRPWFPILRGIGSWASTDVVLGFRWSEFSSWASHPYFRTGASPDCARSQVGFLETQIGRASPEACVLSRFGSGA